MKRKFLNIVILISGFLLWGCYPNGPDYVEDLDVVLTSHNENYDFVSKATYAMPDRIVKITGNLSEGDSPEFIPDATAKLILDRIASNMATLGWERVAIDANPRPHLLLTPGSLETTTIYYWYDYWYWWYGGYYPGGGWGYPPVYYDSYTTGTLLMTLIDPLDLGANGTPIKEWIGAGNGIMTNSFSANRVYGAIDKAFELSPYLKTK
jgi:hypothetical protein